MIEVDLILFGYQQALLWIMKKSCICFNHLKISQILIQLMMRFSLLVASQGDVSRKLNQAFHLDDSFNFNFFDEEPSDIYDEIAVYTVEQQLDNSDTEQYISTDEDH